MTALDELINLILPLPFPDFILYDKIIIYFISKNSVALDRRLTTATPKFIIINIYMVFKELEYVCCWLLFNKRILELGYLYKLGNLEYVDGMFGIFCGIR